MLRLIFVDLGGIEHVGELKEEGVLFFLALSASFENDFQLLFLADDPHLAPVLGTKPRHHPSHLLRIALLPQESQRSPQRHPQHCLLESNESEIHLHVPAFYLHSRVGEGRNQQNQPHVDQQLKDVFSRQSLHGQNATQQQRHQLKLRVVYLCGSLEGADV